MMLQLPIDFSVRTLRRIANERGGLFEGFRASWFGGAGAFQWNVVDTMPHVLRGMHAHLAYDEYYLLLEGTMTLGMRDTRPGSPTEGLSTVIELDAKFPQLVAMPTGIMHGIYARSAGLLLVGMTREWDGSGQTGCHWADPDLNLDWQLEPVHLSPEDAALPPLREVLSMIPRYHPGDRS